MNSLFKQNKPVFSILFHLLTILIMLLHTSCSSCNGDQGATGTDQDQGEGAYTSITMQVPNGPLTGKNKNLEVTFQLADTTKQVDLKDFKLRVSLQEKGDTTSKISYTNPQGKVMEITNLQESLAHFTAIARLTPVNKSFKVPFTFITAPKTTHLEASFELLDQQGNPLQQGKVAYQADSLPVDLEFSLTSAQNLQDDQRTISLAIQNKGIEKTAPKQLQLKITRQQGSEAQLMHLDTLLLKKGRFTGLADLPVVDAHTTLPYDLDIQPGDDLNASFVIALAYEGKQVGDTITLNWENTRKIKVGNFKYNKGDNKIYYTLFNEGKTAANNLTLSYTVKTPGAQLGGANTQAIPLGVLKPSRKKKFTLDNLDFGGNKIAIIEFAVAYEENGTKKMLPSFTKTFTQADIDLGLEIAYENTDQTVSIIIQNNGAEDAEKLKLIYKNVSQDLKGKLASLFGEQENQVSIDKVTQHSYNQFEYKLNLKEASAATFYFEIQYANKPIVSHTETFQENAEFSLAIQESIKDEDDNYILYGAENKVVLNIENTRDSCPIDMKYLQIFIGQGAENTLLIATTPEGTPISGLAGDELEALGDDLTLYAKPKPGTKEAAVTFQLQYKGQDVGDPVTVNWKEYELWVEAPAILVGNNPGEVKIENLSNRELDFSKLTVELTSDHSDLTPQFRSLDAAIQLATLDQVIKDKLFTFQVNTTNHPTKGELKVIIKRDTTELAKKQISWINEGMAFNFSLKYPLFADGEEIKSKLTNTGTTNIDLKQVKVKMTNTSGATFRLGEVSGSTIEENLATITGEDELAVGANIDMGLQADKPLAEQLLSGITIELIDIHTNLVLQKLNVYCVGNQLSRLEETLLENKGTTSIKDAINQTDPNTGLRDLVAYLFISEKLIQEFQKILDQNIRISASHLEFKPISEAFEKVLLKKNNEQKDYTVAIQKIFTGWYKDKVQPVMEELQRKTRVGNKELEELNTIKSVTDFLIGDWKDYHDIDQQSIKGLYQQYHQKIDYIKAALTDNAINNLEPVATDLPAIQDLKQIYQTMMAQLPHLKKDAQAAFIQVVNGVIESNQQKIEDAIEKKYNDKSFSVTLEFISDTNNLLAELAAQQEALSKAQTEELGFELIGFDNLLAINYQTLAEQLVASVEFEENKFLANNAALSIDIKNKVVQIFKKYTSNDTTKQAAKKTIEATIKVWNQLKNKQGENLKVELKDRSSILVKEQLTQLDSDLASVQ